MNLLQNLPYEFIALYSEVNGPKKKLQLILRLYIYVCPLYEKA